MKIFKHYFLQFYLRYSDPTTCAIHIKYYLLKIAKLSIIGESLFPAIDRKLFFLIICKFTGDREGIIFITRHAPQLYNINSAGAL